MKLKMLFLYAIVSVLVVLSMARAAYSDDGSKNGGQEHKPHWGYEGKGGPAEWGKEKVNEACFFGKRQSPIDIRDNSAKKNKSLPKINFSYSEIPLKILNNGHTIQVNYPKGSSVSIGSEKGELLQFHFHTPSEHAFDGKRTDMEVHFVHKKEDGSLIVVGVLMKEGKENKELSALFDNLPKKAEPNEVPVANAKLNPMSLLPNDDEYYTYQGSLTTPPCSEIVHWYVMKDKIEVSSEQIKSFKRIYAKNARPVQSISQRIVEEKD